MNRSNFQSNNCEEMTNSFDARKWRFYDWAAYRLAMLLVWQCTHIAVVLWYAHLPFRVSMYTILWPKMSSTIRKKSIHQTRNQINKYIILRRDRVQPTEKSIANSSYVIKTNQTTRKNYELAELLVGSFLHVYF